MGGNEKKWKELRAILLNLSKAFNLHYELFCDYVVLGNIYLLEIYQDFTDTYTLCWLVSETFNILSHV